MTDNDKAMLEDAASGEYIHTKTGNIYVLLSYATDCTNERDGTPVVIYALKGDMANVYVRAEDEFNAKFLPRHHPRCGGDLEE